MEASALPTMSQAIELFDQEKYQEAFELFVEVYRQDRDPSERAKIFRILEDAYYLPNKAELRQNYGRNAERLKKYPYFFCEPLPAFEEIDFQMFPVSDETFYCYDRNNDCFTSVYTSKTEQRTRYLFENLDGPFQVEDEDNLFNLTYLNDNVRSSEDFAGDNHIYLMYSSLEPLERLMLSCDRDLGFLLANKKFVFLVGENRSLYPLDFKQRFGIDYHMMMPQKLRVEEMHRICFWYKRGYSGSSFGVDVLAHNPYVVGIEGVELFYRSYIKGYPIFQTNYPESILSDTTKQYTLQGLKALHHHPDIQWGIMDLDDFIHWLDESNIKRFTIPELFRAYFVYKYHRDKPHMNPRVVPVILWEPHLNATDIHNALVLSFPYRVVLNSFRDPIQTLGRIFQREGSIFIHQVYAIGYSMHPELRKSYYSYRFEDLKLHPSETCIALCEVLNVPYDTGMLDSDLREQGINGEDEVRGFDLSPLHRNIDSAYSRFDQIRLQIYYDAILRHYGYPTFDFNECPMDENDIAFLMKFPFKCEKPYVESGKWEKTTPEQLRQQLFQNMMTVWHMAKQGKLVFPRVIFPKLNDSNSVE